MQHNSISPQGMSMDCLNTLKHFTVSESFNILECSTPHIRNKFQKMSQEHQAMAEDWFQLMHRRGWYPVSEARPEKIKQTLSQISSLQSGISDQFQGMQGQQGQSFEQPVYGQQPIYGQQGFRQQSTAQQDKSQSGSEDHGYLR
ncbi:MAG: spore coat protein [Clostridia bacterium]|nr:spore coat protein [Clostridia bacterium]